MKPGDTIVLEDGQALVLGKLIKSGGAGSVYLLPGSPAQVAKLYHPHLDREANRKKLAAMLNLSPELPDQLENGKRYVQIAWPQAAVRDRQGNFLGFVMPLLDMAHTAELEQLLQERQARAAGLPTGLGAKMTLAANLAGVLAALHQQHHYVVDLKPVNLRFYRDSLYIAMLDCDGFSIQGRDERYRAEQFTTDYLAPECQGKGMPAGAEAAQDRFALAVVIFQLLNFGIHPYGGRAASTLAPTEIAARIRDGYYPHGIKPHRDIVPNVTSGHALMPPELRTLFDRAFAGPAHERPSAPEWMRLLRRYALRNADPSSNALVVCRAYPEHQHFAGLGCAACARVEAIAAAGGGRLGRQTTAAGTGAGTAADDFRHALPLYRGTADTARLAGHAGPSAALVAGYLGQKLDPDRGAGGAAAVRLQPVYLVAQPGCAASGRARAGAARQFGAAAGMAAARQHGHRAVFGAHRHSRAGTGDGEPAQR